MSGRSRQAGHAALALAIAAIIAKFYKDNTYLWRGAQKRNDKIMATYFYITMLVALVLWGVFLFWRWRETDALARDVLADRKSTGELPDHVDEEAFLPLFRAAEGPRAQTYLFVSAAIASIGLPPYASAFNTVWRFLWRIQNQSPVFETGTLIHTFAMFVAFILMFIGLLALFMRRYHSRAPMNLRQVVRQFNKDGQEST